ncbi:hypothetical protein [Rhodococcus opacus]|uniref:hypothetical protein n=2 Tax=Nocardiaceae TaxID=85025 RepID=UPI0024BB38B8|nr:hypothetical protein [Rhodococcus opacus]MDJ0420362.1 hypothetical protein [Rhodococcus opacus]
MKKNAAICHTSPLHRIFLQIEASLGGDPMHPSQPQRPIQPAQNATGLSDEDQLSLLMAAPLILGLLVAALPAMSTKATAWLLAHDLIVAASASPLVTIPGTEGAGLDLRRLIIVVAVLVLAVTLALSGARRSIDRRRQQRLRRGDSA